MKGDLTLGPMTVALLLQTGDTAIIKAVMDYRKDGTEPTDLAVWPTVRDEEDRRAELSAKRSAAGRAGGFAKANSGKKLAKVGKMLANSGKTVTHAQEETSSLSNIETSTLTLVEEKNNYVIPKEEPPSEPSEPQPFALTSEPVPVPAKPAAKKFKKPDVFEVAAYCKERGNQVDAQQFVDFYESKGWLVGKTPMKDWRAAVRTWEHGPNNGAGYLVKPVARGDPTKFYNPEPTDWSKLGQTYDSAKPPATT